MKYAVDRIEENIAVLETTDTKEKINVSIDRLPDNIKEGNILLYKNNIYILDEDEESLRRERIMNKFSQLKK